MSVHPSSDANLSMGKLSDAAASATNTIVSGIRQSERVAGFEHWDTQGAIFASAYHSTNAIVAELRLLRAAVYRNTRELRMLRDESNNAPTPPEKQE